MYWIIEGSDSWIYVSPCVPGVAYVREVNINNILLCLFPDDILISVLSKAVYIQCPLHYNPMGEQSGALKDSMTKVYLGYRNIDEILKLLF